MRESRAKRIGSSKDKESVVIPTKRSAWRDLRTNKAVRTTIMRRPFAYGLHALYGMNVTGNHGRLDPMRYAQNDNIVGYRHLSERFDP